MDSLIREAIFFANISLAAAYISGIFENLMHASYKSAKYWIRQQILSLPLVVCINNDTIDTFF